VDRYIRRIDGMGRSIGGGDKLVRRFGCCNNVVARDTGIAVMVDREPGIDDMDRYSTCGVNQ